MSNVTIEKAILADAEILTDIKKRTFDEEARRWLLPEENVIDYNIQPPGYDSIEVTKYMIRQLHYFKMIVDEQIVGGIIVTTSGKSYGRIDCIFIDPAYQGKGIGSHGIPLIEAQFPHVRTWDLETSNRQVNNHHFYGKMGYETTFKTDNEYCYIKRIENVSDSAQPVSQKDFSTTQYENCNLASIECYQVNAEGVSISNSNVANVHASNCNLSGSTFQNINFRHSQFADLNLSNSEMLFVTLDGMRFVDTSLEDETKPLSFERCNLRNTEIKDCDITGMKINGIAVEELLAAYAKQKKH
jgi:GNAT superfamily N-acetyltransferase